MRAKQIAAAVGGAAVIGGLVAGGKMGIIFRPYAIAPPAGICGSATLQSPYNSSNHPALDTTTAAVVIPAGATFNASTQTWSGTSTATTASNTTFYFTQSATPYQLGNVSFDQIQMGANDWFVGMSSSGVGATIDGQYINQFGFLSLHNNANSSSTADHVEYLTVEHFTTYGVGASDEVGASGYLDILYNTLTANLPGSGAELGSFDDVEYNCMTSNGDYATNAFCKNSGSIPTGGDGCATSSLTIGPQDVTEMHNEIAYNDQCNYEAMPAAYFPITPPSQCSGASTFNGCGCAGGAHFWNVDGSKFEYNYLHDNYDVASWWDTDNNGEAVLNNFYLRNAAISTMIEISYNALIEQNIYEDNGWAQGRCGVASGNPCFSNGNLIPAIYISESGGYSSVVGNSAWPTGTAISTITISGDTFQDNWDGVSLYQSSDRFCASPDNTSTGYCTLSGSTQTTYWDQSASAPTTTFYANDIAGGAGCGQTDLTSAPPTGGSPDYYNQCLWKTQNVSVTNNTFNFNASAVSGCSATSASPCGENGVASQAASGISYSPYQTNASGFAVPDAIIGCPAANTFTGCTSQNNTFTNNTYNHTGSQTWAFFYRLLNSSITISAWQANGWDSGSTFN